MDLQPLLDEMVRRGASDLHLKVGCPPALRINGQIQDLGDTPLWAEDIQTVVAALLSPRQREQFAANQEIDFAFGLPGVGRFRTNIYQQRGGLAVALRAIPLRRLSFEDLNLPPLLADLALRPRGLILVTGVTGSGKTTTLAAMIQHINAHQRRHVITIEDPIEFLHEDDRSIVSQREVGIDTPSFASALRHVLRQDPDVILIGEIRDLDTMAVALQAADTGHLVFSTLHTTDAMQTIHRIISFFPIHQHQEIRLLVAAALQAIVCLRLIPRADGAGRVPACEILVATEAIRDHIIEPLKTPQIPALVQEGHHQYGMQTFDQGLMDLYRKGLITYEDALLYSTSPAEFALRAKGIRSAADASWGAVAEGSGEGR